MRQSTILGTVLGLSLVASYLTWTAEDGDKPKAAEVVVLQASEDQLTAVTWSDEKVTVRIERPKDAAGPYLWVDLTERTEQKVAPPPTPEGEELLPAPEPATKTVETKMTFLGNEAAAEVWAGFAPLRALRELPVGPDTDLAAFGLDAPKAKIEVKRGAETSLLEVGGESFGTKDRYVRLDGRLLLLDDALLRPLQFARTRMVERRLFPFDDKAIERVSVRRGEEQRSFVQKNAADAMKSFYADASTPEKKDVEATNWLGKLLRVRTKDFVDAAVLPEGLAPVFSFVVEGAGQKWPVEILRTPDGDRWFAKAAYTRSVVELTKSLVQEPVDDLASLFDADHGPEEEPSDAVPVGMPEAPATPGAPGLPGLPAVPVQAPPPVAPGAPR